MHEIRRRIVQAKAVWWLSKHSFIERESDTSNGKISRFSYDHFCSKSNTENHHEILSKLIKTNVAYQLTHRLNVYTSIYTIEYQTNEKFYPLINWVALVRCIDAFAFVFLEGTNAMSNLFFFNWFLEYYLIHRSAKPSKCGEGEFNFKIHQKWPKFRKKRLPRPLRIYDFILRWRCCVQTFQFWKWQR